MKVAERKISDDAILSQRLNKRESVYNLPNIRRCADKLHDYLAVLDTQDDEEVEKKHDAFVRELLLYKLEVAKTQDVFNTCDEEILEYQETEKDILSRIDQAQQKICGLRQELIQQRHIRRHKEECEVMARFVNRRPPRSTMQARLKAVQAEVDVLNQKLLSVQTHTELRQRQFKVLMHVLRDLQRDLGEEEGVKKALDDLDEENAVEMVIETAVEGEAEEGEVQEGDEREEPEEGEA